MPKGEIYHRTECAEWIASVRRRSGLSTELFAAKMIRFKDCKGKMQIVNYSKGSVSNWENGKNLPVYMEVVACIAMMDYDLKCKSGQQPEQERYVYVTNLMSRYLNKRLYCKNILELLILQSARGLFPLEEIPAIRDELLQELVSDNEKISDEEMNQFAMSRNTNTLFDILFQETSLEGIKEKVREYRHFYSVGYRALGKRIQLLYETHYAKDYCLDFNSAVGIYAPVYRVSFRTMNRERLEVSRHWLIDFALQLHFNRNDINSILSDAHYEELAEYDDNAESWIREYPETVFGTVDWYKNVEQIYINKIAEYSESAAVFYTDDSDFIPIRFWRGRSFGLKEKMIYAYLLGVYMLVNNMEMILPFYALDYILGLKKTGSLLREYAKLPKGEWKKEWDLLRYKSLEASSITKEFVDIISQALNEPEEIINRKKNEFGGCNFSMNLGDEYYDYTQMSVEKTRLLKASLSKEERKRFSSSVTAQHLTACYSLSTLIYSLMTGFIYKGDYDRDELKFMELDTSNIEHKKIAGFFMYLFKLMLGDRPVSAGENHTFFLESENDRVIYLNYITLLDYLIRFIEILE